MHNPEGTERLPAQIVAQIIRRCMGLPSANVWLRDQNKVIPNDNGLYIIVGMVNAPTVMMAKSTLRGVQPTDWDKYPQLWDLYAQTYDYGTQSTNFDVKGQNFDADGQTWDQATYTMLELSSVQQREDIQIDVLSRSNDGITRNWEVLAALTSIFSEQMQEYYSFKIFKQPRGFINTSSAEGGSQINRYSITFPTFVWYEKATVLTGDGQNFFDNFPARAITDGAAQATSPTDWDESGETFDQPGQKFDQNGIPLPPPVQVIADFEINQEGIEQ